MRIVLDLQACQSGSRLGGIGRYSLRLTEALALQDQGHELRVVLSDLLPEPIPELYTHLQAFLPRERIHVFQAPGPVVGLDPRNRWRQEAGEWLREDFLQRLRPDIVQVHSVVEGYGDNVLSSIGRLHPGDRTSATFYDVIPLVQPERYLGDPVLRAHYLRKIDEFRRAGLLLAISEFSRQQGIAHLGLDPERIINIAAGVEPEFHPGTWAPEVLAELRSRLGIPGGFILFAGSYDARKNQAGLVQAWAALPPALRADRQLVLVGGGTDTHYQNLYRLAQASGLPEQAVVCTGRISDADLILLYNHCDLFVFPSLMEGYGLPVLEAMACGAPTIAADNSSIPEVVGRADALFDARDPSKIAARMAQVLQDPGYAQALREHGLRQARQFTWARAAATALDAFTALHQRQQAAERTQVATRVDLIPALRDLERRHADLIAERPGLVAAIANNRCCRVDLDPAQRRIGWVTTWNTRCGIAVYAQHLAGAHTDDYFILAAHTHSSEGTDGENVHRCWTPGAPTLDELVETIYALELDTVLIQFNYGLFDFPALRRCLQQLYATGQRVFITLHATTDNPDARLQDLAPVLQLADGVFVHTVADIARLAALDISDNVELFPHGIPDWQPPPPGARPPGFCLASYGFFLPHKGFLEILDALAWLHQAGHRDIHLRLVTARYPVDISADLIATAQARIAAYGLADYVTLITDFLPDEASLEWLAGADLVVFAYQETGESSSAAVRMGLAAGRPVAVTPLGIFKELGNAVARLPGTTPADLAAGILQLRTAIASQDPGLAGIQHQASVWRAAHAYPQLTERLWQRLQQTRRRGTVPAALAGPPAPGVDPIFPQIPADLANADLVLAPWTCLYVGSLVARRQPERLLDALEALHQAGERDLRLRYLVPAQDRVEARVDTAVLTALQKRIAASPLAAQVELRLDVPDADILTALQEADAFIELSGPLPGITRDTLDARRAWLWRAASMDLLLFALGYALPAAGVSALGRVLPADGPALAERMRQVWAHAGHRAAMLDAQRAAYLPQPPRVPWSAAGNAAGNAVGSAAESAAPAPHRRIRIEGPLDSGYSLAIVNREIARGLRARGHAIHLHQTDGYGDRPCAAEWCAAEPELAAGLTEPAQVDVTLRNLYPPRTAWMRGTRRILGPYGWEETGFPAAWIRHGNRRLTGVACMSHFVADVLRDNGLRVPTVVTGIVATGILDHPELDPGISLPEGPRLLHVSSCFPRKGIDVLLAAHARLAENCALIVKGFANPHNRMLPELAARGYQEQEPATAGLRRFALGDRVVLYIEQDLPPGAMRWLYRQADVVVMPSRGEGFGLPMAEALLLEKPLVTTDSGGHADFCTGDNAWLVHTRPAPAQTHFALPGSLWREPDLDHLMQQINTAVVNLQHTDMAQTQRVRQDLLARYSADPVCNRLESLFDHDF